MGSKARRQKREALATITAVELQTPIELPEQYRGLRIIRTARTYEEMATATEKGFYPLLVKVEPNPEIRYRICVYQNQKTGQVIFAGERDSPQITEDDICILPETFYYPHSSPLPIAAYLLPKDLPIGEKVWLEDVIEDLLNGQWGGNILRLYSGEATWNGQRFEIQHQGRVKIYG